MYMLLHQLIFLFCNFCFIKGLKYDKGSDHYLTAVKDWNGEIHLNRVLIGCCQDGPLSPDRSCGSGCCWYFPTSRYQCWYNRIQATYDHFHIKVKWKHCLLFNCTIILPEVDHTLWPISVFRIKLLAPHITVSSVYFYCSFVSSQIS